MTNEEHKMVSEIYDALFNVPPGSPEDEKPLIEGMRVMWRSYQRGSWAMRMVVWGLPTLAGIGMAIQYFANFWPGSK